MYMHYYAVHICTLNNYKIIIIVQLGMHLHKQVNKLSIGVRIYDFFSRLFLYEDSTVLSTAMFMLYITPPAITNNNLFWRKS